MSHQWSNIAVFFFCEMLLSPTITIEGGVCGNSSISSALQDSITLEYPCWEEYKVSA